MTPGDLALGLMLLDPGDNGACTALLTEARSCAPSPAVRAVVAGLESLLALPVSARGAVLAELLEAFDAASREVEVHPFHTLAPSIAGEFVGGLRSTGELLERAALAAEGGEALPLAQLRRVCHTLKGEAGMVGLDAVVAVVHAIETRLADDASDLVAVPGALLSLSSWLVEVADGLVVGRIPVVVAAEDVLGHTLTRSGPDRWVDGEAAPPEVLADLRPMLVMEPGPPRAPAPLPRPDPSDEDVDDPVTTPFARDEDTLLILGEFMLEATDGVTQADELLMRAEQGDAEAGDIDTLFRTFHSMKGVAAAVEMDPVTHLAHAMEDLLALCREGKRPFEGKTVAALLDATQLMRVVLGQVHTAVERHLAFTDHPAVRAMVARLREVCDGGEYDPNLAPALVVPPDTSAALRPREAQPPASSPHDFADQGGRGVGGGVAEGVSPSAPSSRPTATPVLVGRADRFPVGPRSAYPTVAPTPVTRAAGTTEAPVARADSSRSGRDSAPRLRETVKVDLERVDLLVELIGELVIAESMVAGRAEASAPDLRHSLRHLTKIVRDLQRMGVGLRMVPLAGVFQKMRRLVRDLCVKVGKDAVLHTVGETIEMDRSLVEQVADPLVHILRNSMDHGLETPEERLRAGKPAQGVLTLSAAHEAGNIVIEVRDDGRGMNRERILARARERGIVAPDAQLSDPEIYELVFAPGFSTAETITEVSGRGVGMDVVKRNVESMGGRVRVDSTPGRGSTVRLTVPLTLAIIDGMLIGCGGERFIVPTLTIVESIRPVTGMVVTFAGRHEVVDVRGALMPLLRLDRALDLQGAAQDPREGLLLIVDGLTRRFAILVDEVISRQQVVIKAMDSLLVDTRFYSGACILADGRAGLILNVDALVQAEPARIDSLISGGPP